MTQKLLAVDDSKTMRKVLEITFGGENFATTICGSAAEALDSARSAAPAVALIDGGLPGSYDLVRELKSIAPNARVVVLSSKHRPYDESQGSAAGADGNFDKPFDSQKLLDKIHQLSAGAPAPAVAPRPAIAQAAPRPAFGQSPAPSTGPRPVAAAPVAAAPVAAAPVAVPRPASSAPRPAAPIGLSPSPAPVAKVAPLAAPASAAGAAAMAGLGPQLQGLGLTAAQIEGVLALSKSVVEQVVWEVVPVLAETLIKEEIARLTAE